MESIKLYNWKTARHIGTVQQRPLGWIFIPALMGGYRQSRKHHPTPFACVPAWAKKLCGGKRKVEYDLDDALAEIARDKF